MRGMRTLPMLAALTMASVAVATLAPANAGAITRCASHRTRTGDR